MGCSVTNFLSKGFPYELSPLERNLLSSAFQVTLALETIYLAVMHCQRPLIPHPTGHSSELDHIYKINLSSQHHFY